MSGTPRATEDVSNGPPRGGSTRRRKGRSRLQVVLWLVIGVVVIGGLFLSTLLTLLIVPATFSLAVGVERRVGPWLGRKLLTYRPGDEDGYAIDQETREQLGGPKPRIGREGPAPAE